MNLKHWTLDHTKGLILGILIPIIFMPLVVLLLSWIQDYYIEQLWDKFLHNNQYRIRIITISIIANLGLFYYFLNKERFNLAMGIILGSICFAPYIIYVKFF